MGLLHTIRNRLFNISIAIIVSIAANICTEVHFYGNLHAKYILLYVIIGAISNDITQYFRVKFPDLVSRYLERLFYKGWVNNYVANGRNVFNKELELLKL